MYLSKRASRIRVREAENARKNRLELTKAFNNGQVNRRELIKWGALTTAGTLAVKNGLSPFATSAYAQIPTGVPSSPLFNAQKFTQPMPRLDVVEPWPLTRNFLNEAMWPSVFHLPNSKRYSYHNEFNAFPGPVSANPWRNRTTNRGPMEGRPPGEFFKHQRWDEFFPKKGRAMAWGPTAPGTKFHPDWPDQETNKVWSFHKGQFAGGPLRIPLIKGRYGEPMIMRMYNRTPVDRTANGDIGRNETQLHFHNAHNGAESDGATAAHHYPGTFYDYLWSTALARHDAINTDASDFRAAGPDDGFGINQVPGDWREIQGTMWIHDHRFFFTAPNVYKGAFGMVNYYSGIDRGHERLDVGGNLRLPSGFLLNWGNVDFDVNLVVHDAATDQEGQLYFDNFTSEATSGANGFVGDLMFVNFAYAPYMDVLPRKYRFRILNACMSRFVKLALAHNGSLVPFTFIANDGNLVPHPIPSSDIVGLNNDDDGSAGFDANFRGMLDEQGTAERYDIVVDFSAFPVGSRIQLVNVLPMSDVLLVGAMPGVPVPLSQALQGVEGDPAVGPIMEFRVASSVPSVDVPGVTLTTSNACGSNDRSQVPAQLTEQIPIIPAADVTRHRLIEFHGLGTGLPAGGCIPECPEPGVEGPENFPWRILINDGANHRFNANRISLLVPEPNTVERWTLVGGIVWDHPVHMHFEEGVTIGRGDNARELTAVGIEQDFVDGRIPITERGIRKDVWRVGHHSTRPFVTFQVRFGEFGGSYVTHCHNTVHEDFAMLLRLQLLSDRGPQQAITPTPIATPDGVHFLTPDILPEGDPNSELPPSSEDT